jgi:hypothetical protein
MIKIILNDTGMEYAEAGRHFKNADSWARANCSGYKGSEVIDVSDFSMYNDILCEYVFEDEKHANWFKMRWS